MRGAIDAGADRKNQERIVDAIDPAVVRNASDRLAKGALDGMLDSFDDPARQARLRKDFGDIAKGLQIPIRVDHIDRNTIGDIVDESMSRVMTPENGRRLRDGMHVMIDDAVATAFHRGSDEMGALGIGPALAVGARDLSKQATLGFQDAIDETAKKKRSGKLGDDEGNVLDSANRAATASMGMLPFIAVGLALFAATILGVVFWVGRRTRASRADITNRDQALLAVLEVFEAAHDAPWAGELNDLLRDKLHDRENADHLRRLLKAQRSTRPPSMPAHVTSQVSRKVRATKGTARALRPSDA